MYKKIFVLFSGFLFFQESGAQTSTTVTLYSTKDAFIQANATTTNNGSSTYIQNQKVTIWRGLVEFDLSGIPKGAKIMSATLKMYKFNGDWNQSLYIQRITNTWSESTVTWNTAPSTSTSDQSHVSYTSGAFASGTINYDVKTHIEKLTCTEPNYGFMFRYADETTAPLRYLNFRSREHTTTSQKPQLEIQYADPIELTNVTVTHSSTTSSNNGSIAITHTGGLSPFSYEWKNSAGTTVSTSEDPTGLDTDLYSLKITDANSTVYTAYVIVGNYEEETTVNIQPDAIFGLDASTLSSSFANFNYETNDNFIASKSSLGIAEGFIKFNFYGIPQDAIVSSAKLFLYANAHVITSSNSSYLSEVTEEWCEPCITHNSIPAITTTDQKTLAAATSTSQDYEISIPEFVESVISSPYQNYGLNLKLVSTANDASMYFHSSDAVTSSDRPKLEIKFTLTDQYALLSRQLDGGYYKAIGGHLLFKYEEEYEDSDGSLQYSIYPYPGTSPATGLSSLSVTRGTNLYDLDISSLTTGNYFVLVVTNEKGEKWKLRFQKV